MGNEPLTVHLELGHFPGLPHFQGMEIDVACYLGFDIQFYYWAQVVLLFVNQGPDKISFFVFALFPAVVDRKPKLADLVPWMIGAGCKADPFDGEWCPQIEEHRRSIEEPRAAEEVDARRMHKGRIRIAIYYQHAVF